MVINDPWPVAGAPVGPADPQVAPELQLAIPVPGHPCGGPVVA
jgi:hypothetical protein